MSESISIHPETPQARLVSQVVDVLRREGVIIYPTDSSYALGAMFQSVSAVNRIRAIRRLSDKHHLTLVCEDVSQVSNFSKMGNRAFRLIRSLTPGPYTFLLDATREVPRKLHQKNKRTIGIRIPQNPIALAIVAQLGMPLVSTTLQLPDDELAIADPYDALERVGHQVDAVVFGGLCNVEQTTIIDLTDGHAEVIRHGLGPTEGIE